MARAAHPLAGRRVWARRRARALALLVSIGATVFVLALSLSATIGFVANASAVGIRSTLESAPAGSTSVTLRAPLARDGAAQAAGVRAVIATTFGGAPLTVTRTLESGGSDVVRWTITPDPDRTTVADLGKLEHGFHDIEAAVTKSPAAHSSGVVLTGRGSATVLTLVRAVGAQNSVEPIPITALILAGIVALILARSLLTDARQNETRLLRSRGGSAGAITKLDSIEAVVVCATGTAAGAAAAQGGLFWLFGEVPDPIEVVLPPVAVFLLSVTINVVLAGIAARAASGSPRPESGRRRATAPLTLTGFGVVLAGIALWRFEQNGDDGATFAADPSAVLAPAVLLCAGVLLCLLAAGRVTAGLEVLLRRRGTRALFPVRSVNRHIAIVAGPTALLALALALAGVTGAYSGTWQRFATDSGRLTTGGDLRATVDVDPVLNDASDLVPLRDFTAVRGVDAAAIAISQADTFGDVPVTVVAVPAAQLAEVVPADSSVSDPRAIARDLGETSTVGIALPAGATTVRLATRASGEAAHPQSDSVTLALWLGDRLGALFPLTLKPAAFTAAGSADAVQSAALPPSGGPWIIEAIDASVTGSTTLSDFRFRVGSIQAGSSDALRTVTIPSTASWSPRNGVFGDGTSTASAVGTIGFDRSAITAGQVGGVSVRMMPRGTAPVRVVLSRPFAGATGLVRGSRLSVDGEWASFSGVVAGIVAGVPGATNGDSMIASLPALDRAWLQSSEQVPSADQLWMSSSTPDATAARIHRAIPDAQVTLASAAGIGDIIRGATTSLWIGSLGTSAFAIIALIAAILALVRRRSIEARALRALGVGAAAQSSLRVREIGILAGIGATSGLVAGLVVSILVSGTMARLSTPTAPGGLPLSLEFDPLPVAVIVAILLLAIVVSALGYGARVRRQAGGRS